MAKKVKTQQGYMTMNATHLNKPEMKRNLQTAGVAGASALGGTGIAYKAAQKGKFSGKAKAGLAVAGAGYAGGIAANQHNWVKANKRINSGQFHMLSKRQSSHSGIDHKGQQHWNK